LPTLSLGSDGTFGVVVIQCKLDLNCTSFTRELFIFTCSWLFYRLVHWFLWAG